MSDRVVLKIRNKNFEGWTSVQIDKSIFHIAGAFGLRATDIFPGSAEKWGLAMGDECQVLINGQVVITGYVDDIPIDYDGISHNIQIGGRDKTGDLVDCSYIENQNEWRSRKVIDIIKAICKPYGITVTPHSSVVGRVGKDANSALFSNAKEKSGGEGGKENEIKIDEGDTAFEAISKLCKVHAALPVSYGDGILTLTEAGTAKTFDPIELGRNAKRGRIEQSDRERYSVYIVKGHDGGFDWLPTIAYTSPHSIQVRDNILRRYRPLVILAEKRGDSGKFTERAKWEMITRAGRSRSLEYEIQGWTQSNGEVWPLNSLVRVKDSFLDVDGELLITDLSFVLNNEEGTITRMRLTHPNAFKLELYASSIQSGFDWIRQIQLTGQPADIGLAQGH